MSLLYLVSTGKCENKLCYAQLAVPIVCVGVLNEYKEGARENGSIANSVVVSVHHSEEKNGWLSSSSTVCLSMFPWCGVYLVPLCYHTLSCKDSLQ